MAGCGLLFLGGMPCDVVPLIFGEQFSLGHWSRTELVRSFVRFSESDAVLPLLYQARLRR